MPRTKQDRDEVEDIVAQASRLGDDRGFHIGVAVGVLVTVAIGIFIVQNTDATDLEYLGASFNVPLWLGLLAAFLAGCVAGPLLSWSWRRHRRHKQERKSAEKAIRAAARERA